MASTRGPDPGSAADPDSTVRYVQNRVYEPTPIDESAPSLEKEQSPFLGLGAFQRKDAHLFFGRHRETREALAWLGSQVSGETDGGEGICRWLQIEGNSGAGKSSLVNAGMLPLVERGVLGDRTGFVEWRIIGPMMPGEHPLRRLAEALERAFVSDPERRDTLARQGRLENDERALAYLVNDR
ncbi:MAG: hypothetical protein U9R74_12340, partial [Pseudomonadota bacterium]|nr:hypothetical protein [Pseudomonadota bacterium]